MANAVSTADSMAGAGLGIGMDAQKGQEAFIIILLLFMILVIINNDDNSNNYDNNPNGRTEGPERTQLWQLPSSHLEMNGAECLTGTTTRGAGQPPMCQRMSPGNHPQPEVLPGLHRSICTLHRAQLSSTWGKASS